MVSPSHGFETILMSVYVRHKARREAPVPKASDDVLLRKRQVSNEVNFLLSCMSEKCYFYIRMFGRYVSCEK